MQIGDTTAHAKILKISFGENVTVGRRGLTVY